MGKYRSQYGTENLLTRVLNSRTFTYEITLGTDTTLDIITLECAVLNRGGFEKPLNSEHNVSKRLKQIHDVQPKESIRYGVDIPCVIT